MITKELLINLRIKKRTLKYLRVLFVFLAGYLGFEPRSLVLETKILTIKLSALLKIGGAAESRTPVQH